MDATQFSQLLDFLARSFEVLYASIGLGFGSLFGLHLARRIL